MTFENSKPFLCFPPAPKTHKTLQLASVTDFWAEPGKTQRVVISNPVLYCCTEILLQGYVLPKNIIPQIVSHTDLLFRKAMSEKRLENKYYNKFVLLKMLWSHQEGWSIVYRKSKKTPKQMGGHAPVNIVNTGMRLKLYFLSGLLRCPFCCQILKLLTVCKDPACTYSSLSFSLS